MLLKGQSHLQKSCQMYVNCMSHYGLNAADHEYHIYFSQKSLNFSKIEVILSVPVTSSQTIEGFLVVGKKLHFGTETFLATLIQIVAHARRGHVYYNNYGLDMYICNYYLRPCLYFGFLGMYLKLNSI